MMSAPSLSTFFFLRRSKIRRASKIGQETIRASGKALQRAVQQGAPAVEDHQRGLPCDLACQTLRRPGDPLLDFDEKRLLFSQQIFFF